jgi:hypothetical protein
MSLISRQVAWIGPRLLSTWDALISLGWTGLPDAKQGIIVS